MILQIFACGGLLSTTSSKWPSYGIDAFPARGSEQRITEFQVPNLLDGKVSRIGLQIAENKGGS